MAFSYNLLSEAHGIFSRMGGSSQCSRSPASLVGFAITIAAVLRSKSAAELAHKAVADVRENLALQNAVVDLNRLLNDVNELKALHRASVWNLLPTRYSVLRHQLAALRVGCPNLTRKQKTAIQGIIQQFKEIEEIVEKSLEPEQPPPDASWLSRIGSV